MKRRHADPKVIFRVRGYIGDEVRHSRLYQREAAALDNYRRCWDYYERVTLDYALVEDFHRIAPRKGQP